MPNKLRRLSGKEVIAILRQFGFELARVRGSHHIMQRVVEGRNQSVTVPMHTRKPLAPGTLKNIYRQAKNYVPEDDLNAFFYTD